MKTKTHQNQQEQYALNPNKCKYCSRNILYKKRTNTFCSSSCSAKWSNKFVARASRGPTPKLAGVCKKCGNAIHNRYRYCRGCSPRLQVEPIGNKTIQEATYNTGTNKFGRIRLHSKYILKERELKCAHCGYDKHVEVCHIKSIASFPETELVSVVNHESNLILLCPNCHWELDHK